MIKNRFEQIGPCQFCGAWVSKFGLGLHHTVTGDGALAEVYCMPCDKIHHPLSYTIRMTMVFASVDRVPWVPTETEAGFWGLWRIDHWFAERRTVW